MNGKERLLATINGTPVDRPPIWIMRQAGRYLPEYLELKKKHDTFQDLCMNPKVACEIALQPLKRFNLDASIVFADILNLLEACGVNVEYVNKVGPKIIAPPQSYEDFKQLHPINNGLDYVCETIQLIQSNRPDVGMIGFAGSPWTLATYMIEGKITKELSVIKKMLNEQPQLLEDILQFLTEQVSGFCKRQLEAGADMVVIFDTWGGYLNTHDYLKFSKPFLQQIVQTLKPKPVFLFTRFGTHLLDTLLSLEPSGVCIDWTCDLANSLSHTQSHNICLQGNFDPAMLLGSKEHITKTVHTQLGTLSTHELFLPTLGHGITPQIDPNHVAHFIQTLQDYRWMGLN